MWEAAVRPPRARDSRIDSVFDSRGVDINARRLKTRAAGILFRNAISRATVTEHAIAHATEQQYA